MAKESSPRECAESMLEIFRSRNVAVYEILMSSDVVVGLFSMGWRSAEFVTAMQYAEDQHWLKNEGGMIRLLSAGFIEITQGGRYESDIVGRPRPGGAACRSGA